MGGKTFTLLLALIGWGGMALLVAPLAHSGVGDMHGDCKLLEMSKGGGKIVVEFYNSTTAPTLATLKGEYKAPDVDGPIYYDRKNTKVVDPKAKGRLFIEGGGDKGVWQDWWFRCEE